MSDDDEIEIQNQIVEDSKQSYRLKAIEEEGNDPAKPFEKINPNKDASEGGGTDGGPPGGPDSGPPGGTGGGEPGGNAEAELAAALGGEGGGGNEPAGELKESEEIVTEKHGEHADDYERPSQKGVKDARRDFRHGEDPRGTIEMKSALKLDKDRSRTQTIKTSSSLSLEQVSKSKMKKPQSTVLNKLDSYLKNIKTEKRELIKESEHIPSLLDEKNIIDE
jgi:hypothetical protein